MIRTVHLTDDQWRDVLLAIGVHKDQLENHDYLPPASLCSNSLRQDQYVRLRLIEDEIREQADI
jgi:hypothetical protein